MRTTNTNLAPLLWAQPVWTPAQAEEAKLEVDEQARLDLGLASHPVHGASDAPPKARHLPLRLDRYAGAASGEPARHGERLAGGGSFGSGRTQFTTNRRSPGTLAAKGQVVGVPGSGGL
jgi:hypothetical protein